MKRCHLGEGRSWGTWMQQQCVCTPLPSLSGASPQSHWCPLPGALSSSPRHRGTSAAQDTQGPGPGNRTMNMLRNLICTIWRHSLESSACIFYYAELSEKGTNELPSLPTIWTANSIRKWRNILHIAFMCACINKCQETNYFSLC